MNTASMLFDEVIRTTQVAPLLFEHGRLSRTQMSPWYFEHDGLVQNMNFWFGPGLALSFTVAPRWNQA